MVWTEGKGDRIRRSKGEVTMEGHIPNLSLGWKFSTNTTAQDATRSSSIKKKKKNSDQGP